MSKRLYTPIERELGGTTMANRLSQRHSERRRLDPRVKWIYVALNTAGMMSMPFAMAGTPGLERLPPFFFALSAIMLVAWAAKPSKDERERWISDRSGALTAAILFGLAMIYFGAQRGWDLPNVSSVVLLLVVTGAAALGVALAHLTSR
jgi:hypothetical protein